MWQKWNAKLQIDDAILQIIVSDLELLRIFHHISPATMKQILVCTKISSSR